MTHPFFKLFLGIGLLLITTSMAHGQINMSNGSTTISTPTLFYDSGGPGSNYVNDLSMVHTVCPANAGAKVQVTFTQFNLEACCDYLRIYDGNSTSGTLLTTLAGNNSLGTFTATTGSGCLTFEFFTDYSVVFFGWEATLTQVGGSISNAPGGVIADLNTWMRADDLGAISGNTNNANVTSWTATNNVNIIYSGTGNRPKYKVNNGGFNYNPSISFSGVSSEWLVYNGASAGTSSATIVGVYSSTAQTAFNVGRSNSKSGLAGTGGYLYNGAQSNQTNNLAGRANIVGVSGTLNGGANTGTVWGNGVSSLLTSGSVAPTANSQIGGLMNSATTTTNDAPFTGEFAEVVTYNSVLSATDLRKVNSYFAIKYGLTLGLPGSTSETYLGGDGATIWAANTGYHYNITGIGRDDLSYLYQRQSKSVHTQAMVAVGHGNTIATTNLENPSSFASDKSFLLFGDNNASIAAWTTTGAPAAYQILPRNWRAQETGAVGSVKLQVPDNGSFAATKLPTEQNLVYLLLDADGNFAAGATAILMVLNGGIWEVDVDLTNGQFFTFATVNCSPLIGFPVFALSSISTRCQGFNTTTFTATSANASGITYSLDAASLGAGNTINATTGAVIFVAGFTGTTTITATATGCGGPASSTHMVTTTGSVATPVFNAALSPVRCIGTGTVTYTATAANATGITYSLDGWSLFFGVTINAATGAVDFPSYWQGLSTITATAAGCNGPKTATFSVLSRRIAAIDDSAVGDQGSPVILNVLTNDLCAFSAATFAIVTQPSNGVLQTGTTGNVAYLPNGNFVGLDMFTYRVCTVSPVICDTAVVSISINAVPDNPCYDASQSKIFYLPFPENPTQLRKALISAASANGLTNNVRTVVSIAIPYPGTKIIYDHWEEGYELDISQPSQANTLVWGDGNLANGVAPGYPTDIIPAGGNILIDNTFAYNPRNPLVLAFDGKDKMFSNTDIAISKISGDAGTANNGASLLFELQSVKTNVFDISRFGDLFVIPFGEDISLGGTSAFRYTSMFVRAATGGTVVGLDLQGNGSVDVTSPTLNEGEVWFYDGTASQPGAGADVNTAIDIKAGAILTSNFPVGVDLVFGGIDNYGTRNMPILPGDFYGSTYYSPVYSTNTAAPVYVIFTNTLNVAMDVNWTNGLGNSGVVTLPASGSNYLDLNQATGYKFTNTAGIAFTAIAIIDADAIGSSYDWAFNLIPEQRLTSFGTIAWAPGSSNLSANYNPIWVTPNQATTIYVKYDGDVTTGPNLSPCGARYDVTYNLTALESKLLYNPSNDNTGMAIWNCSDVPMAMVWGQRPFGGTPTANPALDVGYVLQPKCIALLVFANDDYGTTSQQTPITISVASNDFGYLTTIDPNSISVFGLQPPANGTIVVNPGGSITYTPNVGFIGVDTFEYQICGQGSPDVCDAAYVIINVPCINAPAQNVINGTVYYDVDLNATTSEPDTALAGYTVQLYGDTNANGVINAGEPLLQTLVSSSIGTYQFNQTPASQPATLLDQFSSGNVGTGSNGTENWSPSPWIELNENDGFGAGNVAINATALRIQGNSSTNQAGTHRVASLSATNAATLTFSYNKSAFSAATTDWVDVQVATSAYGPWTTLVRYSGFLAASGTATFNLTPYLSSTTTIRFIESTDNSFNNSESVVFDNVQIQFPKFVATNYVVMLQPPLPIGAAQSTTPVFYPIAFSDVGEGYCDANFGIISADLVIIKSDLEDPVVAGGNITYDLTVINNGPTDAANVVVNDVLPAGLTLVSATPTLGTWVSPNWSVGTLELGKSASITIVASVANNTPNNTTLLNTATVTSTTPDPILTNNIDTALTTIICTPITNLEVITNLLTICQGGSVNLTSTIGGAVGTTTYQWQTSSNGTTWVNIGGATASSYSAIGLTTNTYYRIQVTQNGGCLVSSSGLLITVIADPIITISVPSSSVCTDGSVVLTATTTGGTGTCTLQWQSSPNGTSSWSNIPGATGTTYTSPNLNTASFYKAIYTCDGSGCCN
jgi:uncharacterized repeat protein (TIGR01451 family)